MTTPQRSAALAKFSCVAFAIGFGFATTCAVQAQPASLQRLPAPLEPWRAWVLAQDEALACPVRDGQVLCFWPGRLALDLDESGGRFAVDVQVDRHLTIALPGGVGRWPLAVHVDGKVAVVIAVDGQPSIALEAGKHHIDGRYTWPHLPESLPLPKLYGQVALSVRAQHVERPKRDDSGGLWLQGDAAPEEQAQLELTVSRKVQDGVPLLVETRLQIRAAGQAREVDLGPMLLASSVPMSIESDLPARLDATGDLRLQVRAGSFSVRVLSRVLSLATAEPTRLVDPKRPPPWPNEEAWVFQADESLRQVQLSGARSVDAARVNLPAEWRGLPTFLVAQGDALSLAVTRRGDPEPVPNQLQLRRTLWLDQDGQGYSVHDHITGEMHSGFRLDLRGFALGRVALHDRDQLITRRSDKGPSGVELRETALDLSADWRAEQLLHQLPAVAWSEDVRSLSVTLNMPPGYALFGVRGVDSVDRSWLQDWDLLGFFFVLLLALGTGRVAGVMFGVLAFVALGISYHEPDAPTAVWIALLVIVALLRVVPDGKARMLVRAALGASLIVFAIQAVPFAVRSLREAIYPQLAQHNQYLSANLSDAAPEPVAEPASPAAESAAPEKAEAPQQNAAVGGGVMANKRGRLASGSVVRGSYALSHAKSAPAAKSEDPDAVVQTGPGLPDWTWQSWQLSWSGPVQRDHRFELWIMPPQLTRSLAVLRVLLCALLAFGLLRAGLVRPRNSRRPPGSAPPSAAGVVLSLLLSLYVRTAHAQFPDQALLQDLHTRLTRPPECRPNCVAVGELDLSVTKAGLALQSEVHAQDRSTVRIPGPAAVWIPESVRIDGHEAQLILLSDGFLHVRVEPGVHKLEARGPLPAQDTLALRLGDAPAHIRVVHEGYDVVGVREDGTANDSLELKRTLRSEGQTQADQPVSLPAWLTLTRELDLGVEFRVHTTLRRETPTGTAVQVHVPLLSGESINDARLQIKDGEVFATLAPDDVELSFDSGLSQRASIALRASTAGAYSEVWRVRCGSLWQCDVTQLVPVARSENGQAVSIFRPWPGEHLSVAIVKPKPAEGQSTTIDAARFTLQPGIRQTDATLELTMRTSRGGVHSVLLPAGSRVRSLTVDGESRPVHNQERSLRFTLLPGTAHIAIALELSSGMQAVFHVPEVRLDTRVVNARVAVRMVSDRWLLWLHGPAWGPAILFWGYLAFAVFAAVLLARPGFTPLKVHEWVLLALGLTQVDSVEALLVVAFFFLFAWRQRTQDLAPLRHNLVQLVLIGATFAAGGALFDAVQHGLLVQPDMQVAGGSGDPGQLTWYVDHTDGALPTPTLISAPLWVYRALMLIWSLWLASRLLRWLPWAFRAFIAGGAWKRSPKTNPKPPPWAAAPQAPPPPAAPPASSL